MTSRYTKRYTSAERCQTAVRNYTWLAQHAAPLLLPALRAVGPTSLVFEFIEGRHAEPADLPRIAAHMGDVHGAAWVDDLHRARLDAPHTPGQGVALADYPTSRRRALAARHSAGFLPSEADLDAAQELLTSSLTGPAAFYKDANPRNFLITADAIVTIDVDDLTLAPFGYDLAKLIVTLTMTHGSLPTTAVREALDQYNRAASSHHESLGQTDMERLAVCMRLHGILTAPYLGRGGYRHRAPDLGTSPSRHTKREGIE